MRYDHQKITDMTLGMKAAMKAFKHLTLSQNTSYVVSNPENHNHDTNHCTVSI